MTRLWTILGVADVARSTLWYQRLLGLPEHVPAHSYFGQVVDSDGTVLVCLHSWGDHDHPPLVSPRPASPGNGLLLFFRVRDLAGALARARNLVATLAEEPHVNPGIGTEEFALYDPDGYYVTTRSSGRGSWRLAARGFCSYNNLVRITFDPARRNRTFATPGTRLRGRRNGL
jgi:catechol 2,3-dioxygenase-like lactoylglutathione lyase family enzyme